MFRHELSTFLQRVLDAVERSGGISVDANGDPDIRFLLTTAGRLDASLEEIRTALEGLRASHCLIEDVLEVPGAEAVTWWRVHPQVLLPAS